MTVEQKTHTVTTMSYVVTLSETEAQNLRRADTLGIRRANNSGWPEAEQDAAAEIVAQIDRALEAAGCEYFGFGEAA